MLQLKSVNILKLTKEFFIGKHVVVNAGAVIGQGAIINSGAIVEHDCEIGEFVHIAPGTVLCGGVKIGRHSHIGTNSTVKQGIHIGSNCFNRNGKRCNKKHKGQCNSLWESVQRGEEPLKVFVIAEAGINHNGELKLAKKTGGCRQRCRC